MATDGYLTKSAGSYYTFYIWYSVYEHTAEDIEKNQSRVYLSWGMRKVAGNSQTYNYNATLSAYYEDTYLLNGSTVAWDMRSYSTGTEKSLYNTTVTIPHDDDGKKKLYLWGKFNPGNVTGANTTTISGYVELPDVPRQSNVTATDANIGSATTIAIAKSVSNYTHTLTYKFGTLSGTIATKTSAATIGWTVPTTFYAQIPNASSGVCTITCVTFNGTQSVGTTTTTFTATAAKSLCSPAIDAEVSDTNTKTTALTGNSSTLVKYYSTAKCVITATAKNSASISKKVINGTTVSGTTLSISNIEKKSIVFQVVDSRGYSSQLTTTNKMIDYVKLSLNPQITRDTPTGDTLSFSVSGNCFNGSFGSVTNAIILKYRYKESNGSYGSYTTVTPTITGSTYKCNLSISGFNYNTEYIFEVVISDNLSSATKTVKVLKGVPLFDWGEESFRFHIPVSLGTSAVGNFLIGNGDDVVSDMSIEDARKSISANSNGTIRRLPVVYSVMDYMGIVSAPCTTQEFMEAMDYNSVVHFTNNKERSVYLTDAPCSYGCATFQKGWSNYNCTGTIVDPDYGYVYLYKYAEGRTNNGWTRMGFGWRTLWTNSSPSSSFDAQTLTISDLSDYNLFTLVCARNTSASHQSSTVMYVPNTTETAGCISESYVSDSGTSVARQRNVYITRDENAVQFTTGWMTGSASGNSAVMIPLYILGVKI